MKQINYEKRDCVIESTNFCYTLSHLRNLVCDFMTDTKFILNTIGSDEEIVPCFNLCGFIHGSKDIAQL
jgi:hypothetical protein